MAEIPENTVTMDDVSEWYMLQAELSALKSKEALLRSRIFKHFFPAPKEGTNNFEISDGTGAVMKGGYIINRSVDRGALDAMRQTLADEQAKREAGKNVKEPQLNIDTLVKWTPEVVIGEYRKLTEEERHRFDQCLVIKPGSPTLEITIPKRAKST